MNKLLFTDSLHVEESFYKAFCACDINLMRDVWSQSDSVICIHPGSHRIYSYELIIASWEQIFSGKETTSIQLDEQAYTIEEDIAIHSVRENLSVNEKYIGSVFATNIYRNSLGGWKMIVHHASPTLLNTDQSESPMLH